MPYEIKFDMRPAGVCVESIRGPGTVKVQVMGFYSEEDGDELIQQLESFPSQILGMIPARPHIKPNQVQHMLVIIRRDATATVYINELNIRGMVQSKRDIKAGHAVSLDDIADFKRLEFDGVIVPKDAAIIWLFAVGWRRGLFFDFSPLSEESGDRQFDIGPMLGQFYSYLMFQARFKIKDQEWINLFDGQWFPFITLKDATIRKLVTHAANSWPLDDLTEEIAQEVCDTLPLFVARWKSTPSFGDHLTILEKAVEHYSKKDYLSAATMLYPRIEGLLRSYQQQADPAMDKTQKGLSASATKKAEGERHASSPLLPAKFREYLKEVYFAAFDPSDPKIKVSRNSVGHGVASAAVLSQEKSATIALLIVDQLWFNFSGDA